MSWKASFSLFLSAPSETEHLVPELIGEEIYDEFDAEGAHGEPFRHTSAPPQAVERAVITGVKNTTFLRSRTAPPRFYLPSSPSLPAELIAKSGSAMRPNQRQRHTRPWHDRWMFQQLPPQMTSRLTTRLSTQIQGRSQISPAPQLSRRYSWTGNAA